MLPLATHLFGFSRKAKSLSLGLSVGEVLRVSLHHLKEGRWDADERWVGAQLSHETWEIEMTGCRHDKVGSVPCASAK